ncbi:Uncharacterized protein At3g06530 [Linum perenne]
MATTMNAQLQALKSAVQVRDVESQKRPFTRPSILFSPKEAADLDIDAIHSIAVTGLEVLIVADERFASYMNGLFSIKSKDCNRELMREEENRQLNVSISSYLRLLSGYLQLTASLKTLEYLIRRYKIYAYNVEDLILCALPYHDTHVFVRLVQLVETRNDKWKFLDGVKASGAPPPRNVIVQQCLRDLGVLETICNYASSSKKFQSSKPVFSFCTSVVIAALGSSTGIGNDFVKRIVPFVVSGLQVGGNVPSDHKACSLMIVGSLASKVSLSPKLVKSLMRSIAEIAQEDAMESTDLQWSRLSILTLINLVQLQCVEVISKSTLEILKEIRDMSGILLEISREFNIDRFLDLLVQSLLECSLSDESYHRALVFIVEKVPIGKFVGRMVLSVLSRCLKISQKNHGSNSSEAGRWAKDILIVINKNYPAELRRAVCMFLEDTKVQSKKEATVIELLSETLDGNLDFSSALSDSRILFGLHHPKASVRRATLSNLGTSGILKDDSVDSQRLVNIQDAVLHQLKDDDLSVVQAALSIDGLSDILGPSDILKALDHVLNRCAKSLRSGPSEENALACDVAASFLTIAISISQNDTDTAKEVASMMFPLLLISPKTQRLNVKVLELAKQLKWKFYHNLPNVAAEEVKLEHETISSINLKIVSNLCDAFSMDPTKHMPWLSENCNKSEFSRTLTFLVVMESFLKSKNGMEIKSSLALFEACFSFLGAEWEALLANVSMLEFNKEVLQWDCRKFLDQLFSIPLTELNTNILICVFWRLLDAFIPMGDKKEVNSKLRDLFVFFATSPSKDAFREHLFRLVTNCSTSPIDFLLGFFTEEDVPLSVELEILLSFSHLCVEPDDRLTFQLLANFPLLLVPLSSENQDLRVAAVGCFESLSGLSRRADLLSKKNGNNGNWISFVDDLLDFIVQQKRLILSDKNFLPSFFTSLLGSSSGGLLVPRNVEHRFNSSTKEKILAFILGYGLQLPSFAKMMILSSLKGLGNMIMHNKGAEELLVQLLERRRQFYMEGNQSSKKLLKSEIKILCLLLEICATRTSPTGHPCEEYLFSALHLNGSSSEELAIVEPCLTVLQSIDCQFYSEMTPEKQMLLFRELLCLSRHADGNLQNATRAAFLQLNISHSTVAQTLDFFLKSEGHKTGPSSGKKKMKKATTYQMSISDHDLLCEEGTLLSSLSSLLEFLVLKKDVAKREFLIGPLFQLLENIFFDEKILALGENGIQASPIISQTVSATILNIQHTLLIVLEDIISSLECGGVTLKDDVAVEVKVLLKCAQSAKDGATRNLIFSLLSSIAKVIPDKIVPHISDILVVIGESTVIQTDSHSQHVFEQLISAIVPLWLDKTGNIEKLLQIFMNVIPEIAEHRRLSLVVYLLRVLGEQRSLASLLLLLFQSLVSRKRFTSSCRGQSLDDCEGSVWREWEYSFAVQIFEQYSSTLWLPSLVMLLKRIQEDGSNPELPVKVLFAMEFILRKLQDPEFTLRLQSSEGLNNIQGTLQELMEHVVATSLLVDVKKEKPHTHSATRKELKDRAHAVLRNIRTAMTPSAYFKGMITLLGNSDGNVKKKALGLLCETLRDRDSVNTKTKGKDRHLRSSLWVHMDKASVKSLNKMCLEIVGMINGTDEESDETLKISAVSTLELLARSFHSNQSVFSVCLPCVSESILSSSLALSSCSLRTTGAFIEVLELKALTELPRIMGNMLDKSREVVSAEVSSSVESFMHAILVTLEQVINKLGGFLNPYLEHILRLLVIHPIYTSESHEKLKLRADIVRGLLTEKIPVRLALPPLLKIYSEAVKSGDSSVSIAFEILARLVQAMDKSSVRGYHEKIFDHCLSALDLRHQHPESIQHIDAVEKSVINATVALTMKLTESMFKPLLVRSIEWVEPADDNSASTYVDRAIAFYGLINKLTDSHRSLFVPYFKYFLDDCISHLTGLQRSANSSRKKKKTKKQDDGKDDEVSLESWHIRALVISALQKCFQYDTGTMKFLDSSNFQTILKPIVSQFTIDPPTSLDNHPDVPSVEEVNDLLVGCVGQMAVAAGSDLLWKPLNHEVLSQTQNGKERSKTIGLRTVKYLVDNLKEEYMVLLPETMPYLAQMLEDSAVRDLARDVVKEMEEVGGESLEEYLV